MALDTGPASSDSLFCTVSEKIAGVVSAAAICAPLWLQDLKRASDVAAILAPILGCIYLSMQIGFKLWDRANREDKHEEV